MTTKTAGSSFLGARDRAVLRLDLMSASRDGVLMLTVVASLVLVAIVAGAGLFEQQLGLQAWRAWIPAILALSLASGPGGPAMIFGSILIEEKETGVGAALSATPTPRARLAILRVGGVTLYIALWLSLATAAILAAWPGAFPAAPAPLGLVILALALIGAAATLTLARLSANRIEALAVFKGLSVILALPVALFFAAPDAWWRPALQILPTGPALEALYTLERGAPDEGLAWAGAALAYSVAWLGAAIAFSRR